MFLQGAVYSLDGNQITVTLQKNGKDILKQLGVESYIVKAVSQRFSKAVSVNIVSSNPDAQLDELKELERFQNTSNLKVKVPVQRDSTHNSGKRIDPSLFEGLPICADKARPVFGNLIKARPKPIKELTPEDGSVVVWGDVFAFEARETKDGKKNIISFNITDYTSSYCAKIFGEKSVCKELIEKVKDGTTVLVRGFITHDSYMRCYLIDVKAVTIVEKTEKQDTAEEKRVELHLHTNMSLCISK